MNNCLSVDCCDLEWVSQWVINDWSSIGWNEMQWIAMNWMQWELNEEMKFHWNSRSNQWNFEAKRSCLAADPVCRSVCIFSMYMFILIRLSIIIVPSSKSNHFRSFFIFSSHFINSQLQWEFHTFIHLLYHIYIIQFIHILYFIFYLLFLMSISLSPSPSVVHSDYRSHFIRHLQSLQDVSSPLDLRVQSLTFLHSSLQQDNNLNHSNQNYVNSLLIDYYNECRNIVISRFADKSEECKTLAIKIIHK